MQKSKAMAMPIGGSYLDGLLEGSSSILTPDHLQTTLFSCPQFGGEVEEVLEKRTIQALVENSIQRGMQTFMLPLVQEAVMKGIRESIPTLVEEEVHKRMQVLMPVMVEEMKKMVMDRFLPLLQTSNESNRSSSSGSLVHMDSSTSRSLQLHFECQGKSGERVYSDEKLKEQGILFQVVLKDDTGNIVEVGPESSIEIKIVVLHSDIPNFDTPVQPREGKPSLLSGTCVSVVLAKGVADLDDIKFTDNSSWVSSKEFRLGAMAVKGVPHGVTIKNGISKVIKVLAGRGECYQKIENPTLNDKVWRLHGIAKDGPIHKRLEEANICSVKDLVLKNMEDPESLRKILNFSEKRFKKFVNQVISSYSNIAQPEYQIGDNGGQDGMPFVNGAPNEMYQASFTTPSIFSVTSSSTQLPLDVAAPILGAEMQLNHKIFSEIGMPSQPEQLIHMFPGFPTPNTFQATGSFTQLPLDVATPIQGVEMQLSHNNFPETELPSQPEQQIDMISELLNEDVNWTNENYGYNQVMEYPLRGCKRNSQPSKSGLHKPRWRSVGVALRFSVFRMVIIRQACRARKKQKLN